MSSAVRDTSRSLSQMRRASDNAAKSNNRLLASVKRVAYYRILRSAIKVVTDAFSEGLKNAYTFSKGLQDAVDGRIAGAMDRLSASGNRLKNQLGAALGSLVTAVTPALVALANLLSRLATALTQVFAVFTGGTYLRAKETASVFYEGAAATKAWRRELLAFDEINRLNDNSSGGSGGGIDPGAMFEVADIDPRITEFKKKVEDTLASIKVRLGVDNIDFDWSKWTGEGIANALIENMPLIATATIAGAMTGGVKGAIFGFGAGVSLSVLKDKIDANWGGTAAGTIADILLYAAPVAAGLLSVAGLGGGKGLMATLITGVTLLAVGEYLRTKQSGTIGKGALAGMLVGVLNGIAAGALVFSVGGLGAALLTGVAVMGATLAINSNVLNMIQQGSATPKTTISRLLCGALAGLLTGVILAPVIGASGAILAATAVAALTLALTFNGFENVDQVKAQAKSMANMSGFGSYFSSNIDSTITATPKVSTPAVVKGLSTSAARNEKFQTKAEGGNVGAGSLFIAGERGAELVYSSAHGASVSNRDQIAASVANGNENVVSALYEVARTIVNTVEGKDTSVYLDGQKVSKGVRTANSNYNRAMGR